MTPATKAGASNAAKRAPVRGRATPVARATRAGSARTAKTSQAAVKTTTRTAKSAPTKVAGRASATTARAPRRATAGTVGRAGARSAERAGAKTTKAVRKTASKETVKSAVTSIARTSKEPKEPKGTERKGGEPAASPRAAKAAKSPVAANSAAAKPAPKPAAKPAAKIPRPAAAPSAPAKKRGPRRAAPAGPYAHDEKFLLEQRQLLEEERKVHQSQASDLKAEADSLAQEREPGDVQFDEESGEGGTVTVDRERDLALSAQALAAVEEIDAALARIENRTYGACERCLHPIPKPRLKALPFARLCVACKSGGLSRR